MSKYFFAAIAIPIILIFSAIIFLPADNFFSYFKIRSYGRILGAEEALGDGIGQVMIAEKEQESSKVEIIKEQINNFTTEIYSIDHGSRLPDSNNKKRGPNKMENCQAVDLNCARSCALDLETEEVIYEKNKDEATPIASITKLMTALVFLEHNPGWDKIYEITRNDRADGGKEYLFLGEKVTVENLFYTSLVGSANSATIAMVHSTGMAEKDFVSAMNEKAKKLGLIKTHFEDVTGLSNNNISTAYETAMLAKYALAEVEINKATLKKEYNFTTQGGRNKKIYTTDYLLENFPENGIRILGGKTGYTDAAKYCFVGKFIDKKGNEIITSVLGSNNMNARFEETRKLAEWVFESYVWE